MTYDRQAYLIVLPVLKMNVQLVKMDIIKIKKAVINALIIVSLVYRIMFVKLVLNHTS